MNVLIIGGSGFIGGRLVSVLQAAGHRVSVFDLEKPKDAGVEYIPGDIRSARAVADAVRGMDVVFNLAAVHRDDIRETALYYEVNVGGMRNLLAACEDASVRKIVFTGTVACYGLDAENPNEDAPTAPFNDYGRSKLEAEDLLRDWAGRTGGHAIIVRPCVVFGEGNRGNVYTLLRQIHQRRFPMVGDGANRKSMAYVANVAEFLAWLAENVDGTQVFNYADKPDLTTREIVHIARTSMGLAGMPLKVPYGLALSLGRACDMVAALTHTTLPFSRIRVVKFCANTMVDAAKAHASGFRARHSLEQALRHTIQHEFGSRSSSSAMP